MIQQILRSTKIKDIMTTPVVSVREEDEFHVVQEKMSTWNIRHLPVVNDGGFLVGVITERHLFKIHSPRRLEDGSWYYDKDMLDAFILRNVMVKDVFSLKPENSVYDVVDAIVRFKYGCIPIVNEHGTLKGIVTRDNIFKFLLKHV